jgi:hypothetical protein
MHEQVITQTVQWIQSNLGETTTKQEVADKMQGADLPESAKDALRDMPDGEHDKQDLIAWVEQALLSRLGSANQTMRGFGGSM